MRNNLKIFVLCFLACLCANSCYHNKKEIGFGFLCTYNNMFEMGWNPKEVCREK